MSLPSDVDILRLYDQYPSSVRDRILQVTRAIRGSPNDPATRDRRERLVAFFSQAPADHPRAGVDLWVVSTMRIVENHLVPDCKYPSMVRCFIKLLDKIRGLRKDAHYLAPDPLELANDLGLLGWELPHSPKAACMIVSSFYGKVLSNLMAHEHLRYERGSYLINEAIELVVSRINSLDDFVAANGDCDVATHGFVAQSLEGAVLTSGTSDLAMALAVVHVLENPDYVGKAQWLRFTDWLDNPAEGLKFRKIGALHAAENKYVSELLPSKKLIFLSSGTYDTATEEDRSTIMSLMSNLKTFETGVIDLISAKARNAGFFCNIVKTNIQSLQLQELTVQRIGAENAASDDHGASQIYAPLTTRLHLFPMWFGHIPQRAQDEITSATTRESFATSLFHWAKSALEDRSWISKYARPPGYANRTIDEDLVAGLLRDIDELKLSNEVLTPQEQKVRNLLGGSLETLTYADRATVLGVAAYFASRDQFVAEVVRLSFYAVADFTGFGRALNPISVTPLPSGDDAIGSTLTSKMEDTHKLRPWDRMLTLCQLSHDKTTTESDLWYHLFDGEPQKYESLRSFFYDQIDSKALDLCRRLMKTKSWAKHLRNLQEVAFYNIARQFLQHIPNGLVSEDLTYFSFQHLCQADSVTTVIHKVLDSMLQNDTLKQSILNDHGNKLEAVVKSYLGTHPLLNIQACGFQVLASGISRVLATQLANLLLVEVKIDLPSASLLVPGLEYLLFERTFLTLAVENHVIFPEECIGDVEYVLTHHGFIPHEYPISDPVLYDAGPNIELSQNSATEAALQAMRTQLEELSNALRTASAEVDEARNNNTIYHTPSGLRNVSRELAVSSGYLRTRIDKCSDSSKLNELLELNNSVANVWQIMRGFNASYHKYRSPHESSVYDVLELIASHRSPTVMLEKILHNCELYLLAFSIYTNRDPLPMLELLDKRKIEQLIVNTLVAVHSRLIAGRSAKAASAVFHLLCVLKRYLTLFPSKIDDTYFEDLRRMRNRLWSAVSACVELEGDSGANTPDCHEGQTFYWRDLKNGSFGEQFKLSDEGAFTQLLADSISSPAYYDILYLKTLRCNYNFTLIAVHDAFGLLLGRTLKWLHENEETANGVLDDMLIFLIDPLDQDQRARFINMGMGLKNPLARIRRLADHITNRSAIGERDNIDEWLHNSITAMDDFANKVVAWGMRASTMYHRDELKLATDCLAMFEPGLASEIKIYDMWGHFHEKYSRTL